MADDSSTKNHEPRTNNTAAPLRYQPLVVVAAAVCAGIVVDRRFALSFAGQFLAAGGLWIAWALARGLHRVRLAALLLLASSAALGGAWHHACWRLFDVDDVATFAGHVPRTVLVEAVVVGAPRTTVQPSGYDAGRSETKTRFTLDVERLREGPGDAAWRRAVGRCDVQIDAAVDDVRAGDRVRLLGRLARSLPPLNPGEFDFAAHYRSERKLCVLRAARADAVTVVARAPASDLWARFSQWRRRGHDHLLAVVPPAQAGFASALLLGYRDQLDRRENWAFFRTGTVHILSISGLHVGMLALFLNWSLRLGWMRRGTALAITMLVTTAYVVVIDAEPPAVRAALTVVLATTAALSLRRPLGGSVLAAAALIVVAMNPADLFRAGPQLSFLAAVVLAWGADRFLRRGDDPFDRHFASRRDRLRTAVRFAGVGFGRMLLVSAAIFLVAGPLVAHRFHIVSPIALVLTPIVALPTYVALLSGFLTLTLGGLVPPLATPLGQLCGESLALCETLVHAAERVPHGWLWLPGPAVWQTALFYVLLAVWAWLPRRTRSRRACGAAVIVWGLASLVPHHTLPRDVALRTTFISVGHGLSVLVEEADGSTWLYDCGRFGAPERGAQQVAGLLWSRGITRLDAIVISHLDADHYNGLPFLLEQFGVGRVIVSVPTYHATSGAAESIRRATADAGVPLDRVGEGSSWPEATSTSDDAVQVRMLGPPDDGVVGNDNAQSIVLELTVRGRRLLLTGDVEEAGLERILALPPTDCDVILAPHHGSARSNPPGLAAWSTPEWVVVSGDEDRRGVVRAAYEAVGARLLETTDVGAVTVDVGRDGALRVSTFRTRP